MPTGADQARLLAKLIEDRWEELGRPWSERAMAYARACARDREEAHRDECSVLVRRTGLDEHAIWQWGAAERVSTGLLLVRIGA
ncbi:MAG TPA: hypothetical protein VND62_08820 [Acidimicrobiales bacterium]|nr:hypothetical protein [Acidimicrobiales bacterium]